MSRRQSIEAGPVVVIVLLCALFAGPALADETETFDTLAAQLSTAEPEDQFNLVQRLAATGDPRAVPLLIRALDQDMRERTGIAMAIIPALGYLGDARAAPILIRSLTYRGDDWLGREAAADALGEIGAVEAVPPLLNAAWMADTRPHAIRALAKVGDPRAVEVLISAFDPAEEPEIRRAAVEGLIRIGPEAVPALIERLEDWNPEYPAAEERALAARTLGEIDHPMARQALTRSLDDPSEAVRASAEQALSRKP